MTIAKTHYTYTIVNTTEKALIPIVTDLETRDDARQELALVKKVYPKAKIIQSIYELKATKQVR